MRVLVVSHALTVPANQALYCEMERLPGVELALVVPQWWKASMGGVREFERHEALDCSVIAKPVRFSGKINVHFYRGLSGRDLPWAPEVIYADEEAYSLAAYQCLRMARAFDVPLVFKTNQNLLKRYPPPFSWVERAVYRRAAAALPCAQACIEVLRAKGYWGPLEVIGFGLDPAVTRPWPVEHLRARLGIPPEAFVIGCMGRFTPEKGVVDLIEACRRLEASATEEAGPEFRVLIVGGGPQAEGLQARAAELALGRVIFAGVVPHGKAAAEHLSCMDVCVVPSRTTPAWKEQFGRVITEAMACGVPVVGSDSGNVPVLIRETGGGQVFPEGDVPALAEALKRLMHDRELARQLGDTGQQYVTREYCYRHLAERMVAAFGAAVEG